MFHSLELYGAGQWVNEVYVPVAAIAMHRPLEFLIGQLKSHENIPELKKWAVISEHMVSFFKKGTHHFPG